MLSISPGFGEDVGRLESECASGGGSMNEEPWELIAASGRGGIASA